MAKQGLYANMNKRKKAGTSRPKKKPTGQLKMNMKKMPPAVQKRLMQAIKRKKK